jgi:hypothetical protein
MSARNVVQEALERFGRQAGLEKKSGAWYRRADEVIAVSDLQKSQYGPQYYFHQGFWLRALGGETYPKAWRCHIGLRLETLVTEERHRIAQLLDLEYEIADDDRIKELVALLSHRMLPVIERGGSIAGLRAMVDDKTLATAAIQGPAQQLLAAVTR